MRSRPPVQRSFCLSSLKLTQRGQTQSTHSITECICATHTHTHKSKWALQRQRQRHILLRKCIIWLLTWSQNCDLLHYKQSSEFNSYQKELQDEFLWMNVWVIVFLAKRLYVSYHTITKWRGCTTLHWLFHFNPVTQRHNVAMHSHTMFCWISYENMYIFGQYSYDLNW